MKCPKCQKENPETNKFCRECGGKLVTVCLQCGCECAPEDKFCGKCGHDLRKPQEAPAIDYRQPSSYTPKHLADKILSNRIAIEGERKLVTILFADVANSTAIFENLDPEQVHEIMDGCFRLLMDEIHRYEGTINQFTGDGVMALFGAPIAHEDHAQRACYASLAIQESLRPYAERLKAEHGIHFTMRVGLNSGSVVVGAIGDDLRMDYTAQGDTANLAARMESNAEPGSVLVSEHTYKLARGFFDFESLGWIQVKGKAESVQAYQLTKPSEVATRIGAAAAKGLTRFVGRKREIETLKDAFDKARSGEGQVVGVVGEAGVGKSRLLLEFRNSLPKREYLYLEGRCLHYGSSMPYLPILDALRTYLGIKEGEKESVIKQKMLERIVGSDKSLTKCLPPIQELFSIKVDNEEFTKLEPKQKREKTFEAVRDILIRGSQSRPIVWAVEDLHWIDKTTEEFLDYMIGWLPNTRILLILLYRPEYTHQWGSKSYYSKVGVGQLSSNTSAELIQAILEGGAVGPELRELILSRAAGNPLFMEELTHSLLENGSVEKKGDQYVLARTVSEVQIPDTVQGIIAARMDRLEESLKRILQVASVIGREFAFRILQAITEMREDLKSNLLNLQGLEFIYEKSLFPELEFIFRHALTQEVAYNSLLIKRRKQIHEKIGQAVEELYPDRLEEFFEMLAYHYSKSENHSMARRYLILSGGKAARKDANREAFRFFKETIDFLDRLPESGENTYMYVDVACSMKGVMRKLAYPKDSLTILQKAERLAEQLGDVSVLTALRSELGMYHTYQGNIQLGRKHMAELGMGPETLEEFHSAVSNAYETCTSYQMGGEFWRVIDPATRMITLLEQTHRERESFGKTMNPYAYFYTLTGLALSFMGDFSAAEKFAEKGLRLMRDTNNPYGTGIAEMQGALMFLVKGDAESAASHYREAIECFEKSQTGGFLGLAWTKIGYSYYLLGEYDTALRHMKKGLKIQTDLGLALWMSDHYWCLGMLHCDTGNLQEALSCTDRALELSRQNNERQWEAQSTILLGRILGKTESLQIEEAEGVILKGLKLFDELREKPFNTVGRLFLGELYADGGQKEKALENLKKAESMFMEMGMDYWLGKTQEVLAKL